VLPIGGLKEKALAAQAAGIARVIAPKLNEQDTEDIPEHLRKDIEFIFVERIEKALEQALEPADGSRNGARPRAEARRRAAVPRGDGVRAARPSGSRKPARPKARSK
jgi:ATP-dependent Lon protease